MPAPDAPFDELTRLEPKGASRFEADLPDRWQQGRGLFGGLVTGVMVRALEASAPGRPLRSLTSELFGPVQPGKAELVVEVLRVGSAMSTLAVRVVQGGETLAHGVGVLGATRPAGQDQVALASPTGPSWREVEVVSVGPPLGPDFARFFELRTTALPFTGGRPEVSGFLRLLRPGEARDTALLAGCIDAYWPAEYVQAETPRPMATVAFTFQPLGSLEGLDPEAPFTFRSRLQAARGGYGVEFRELWGHDGRLLALNQQTICSIK
jgi:hypothetical protein